MSSTPPTANTVGQLRDLGHPHDRYRPVKAEIRENLIARLAAGEDTLPGIVGFDETVTPQVERALLAGHDMVLLGERGQGKTRLARTLVGLLDAWTPVIAGCEINDHPLIPVCRTCQRKLAERGDAVESRPASPLRAVAKLATPDTSVGDLVRRRRPDQRWPRAAPWVTQTVHYGRRAPTAASSPSTSYRPGRSASGWRC
jgi:magnesium chelatase subunit I